MKRGIAFRRAQNERIVKKRKKIWLRINPEWASRKDVEGKFRGSMVFLRPDAATRAEIGPGKGARHSSAAKMSAEAECLAITVSQDGPITVYDSGQRVLSL